MTGYFNAIILFLFCSAITAFAQDSTKYESVFPQGITIDIGKGVFAVRDNFFSREQYSGSMPYFNAGWSQFSGQSGSDISLKFQNSSEIKSGTFSSSVTLFSMNWDFFFACGRFKFFGKDAYIFLGPSTEIFFYYNRQQYARDGLFVDFSFATLFSLGSQVQIIIPLRTDLNIESMLKFSLLSVAVRMPEIMVVEDRPEESAIKLLTPFECLHANFHTGIRYYLSSGLSLKVRYQFTFTKIQRWNPILAASDDVVLSCSVHF